MYIILVGLLGYALIIGFECASRWRREYLKSALAASGFTLIIISTVMAALGTPKVPIPSTISHIAWAPFVIFSALLVYSVFLEVPLRTTYLTSEGERRLVTDGTYSLVRHPGVLWYAFASISLILISQSVMLLIASLFWLAADIACVYVEEKVYLEHLFGSQYRRYQRTTPMLIPNRQSLARFLEALRDEWKTGFRRQPSLAPPQNTVKEEVHVDRG